MLNGREGAISSRYVEWAFNKMVKAKQWKICQPLGHARRTGYEGIRKYITQRIFHGLVTICATATIAH